MDNKPLTQQQPQRTFQPQQQQSTQNPVDLLGLGSSSTQAPITNTSPNNNINLLDEIFSASSYKQTTTSTANSTSNASNILDFASLNSNTQQSQTKPASSQGNLFDMLSNSSNKPATAEGLKKADFTPVSMDTDTFGEYWTNCPHDEKSFDFVSKNINSPQRFFDVIKSYGNFFPVEIIEDQAIACAKLKEKLVLVHATISGFNVNVLVKCFDNSQTDLVAKFLREFI